MKETFNELCNGMDEIMALCMQQVGLSDIATMKPDEFAVLQKAMKLLYSSKKLMEKMIEDQEAKDQKLDEILRLLRTK